MVITEVCTICKQVVRILQKCFLVTAHKRSLRQGNIFAPVCHSVHGGLYMAGGACVVGSVWQGACQGGGMCGRGHVCGRGGVCGRGHAWLGTCVAGGACMARGRACHAHPLPPLPRQILRLRYTVNERAVRILLECILVNSTFTW